MAVRHIPFWFDRYPRSRRPSRPRFRGQAETSVIIVGGGLTGCACAWSFAAAGIKVLLLEAGEVGSGSSAAGPGLVREDFDASFQAVSGAVGLRSARLLWHGMHRGALDCAAALRRLQTRCDLNELELLRRARSDPASAMALRREYKGRRDGGLDHRWVTPAALLRETGLQGAGAIRTRGFALDPYRACLGLAAAAVTRGALIHEHSAVTRIRHGQRQVEVTTERGIVRGDAVVVATGAPLPDLRALRRHLQATSRYAVVTEPLPAAVRREVGTRGAALQDGETPPHLVRWLGDDRVLIVGGDQPEVPAEGQQKALVQRTGQLLYELSTLYPAISGLQAEWSWSATHYETVDSLPFVGPHRNFPRHLFAMGGARHGAGLAWLASRILLRHYQGTPAKGDDSFGFARIL